jgi:hypothetical protein
MLDGGGCIEVVGMISFLALRVISVGFIRRGSSILPLSFTDAHEHIELQLAIPYVRHSQMQCVLVSRECIQNFSRKT